MGYLAKGMQIGSGWCKGPEVAGCREEVWGEQEPGGEEGLACGLTKAGAGGGISPLGL